MHPIFVSIPMPAFLQALFARLGLMPGPTFELHMYGVLIALGVFMAVKIVMREAARRGVDADILMNLLLGNILWGVAGSRLLFVVLNWQYYKDSPLSILNLREGGLIFQGSIIAAALYTLYFLRRNKLEFWSTADLVVVGVPFAHIFGRLGCLSAGCCYGAPTGLPWGIRFEDPMSAGAPLFTALHPVQLYEAAGNLLIFLVLRYLIRNRQAFSGQIFLLYFILYPILRFCVELFRGDDVRGFFLEAQLGHLLSTSQFISLVELTIALALYAWRRGKASPTSRTPQVGEAAGAH